MTLTIFTGCLLALLVHKLFKFDRCLASKIVPRVRVQKQTSNGSDIYRLDAYAVYRIYTQDSFICASTVSDETMLFLLQVKLVSNETGKGINHAVNAIIEHRSGMDVPPGSP